MSGTMLEIKDLTCGYSDKFLLRDICLSVEKKELVGIIGPNGSGKTTLLRAMTRVLKPRKGAVCLEGKDISQMGFGELAKKVAVVSQDFESGSMSVEEFVLLGRIPHFAKLQFLETQKDLDVARQCMILTDTLKFKDQPVCETSGGERQLALIARALAQEPKLLLLDEPTSHLDIAHQVRILDLIEKLNRELWITVIMVLHVLNLACEYCHRLVLIHEGKIVRTGTPSEILTDRTIEEVYQTAVTVQQNPVSGKPCVFIGNRGQRPFF